MISNRVSSRIEGTILDKSAKPDAIARLCKAGKHFGWAGVCIYPDHVSIASQMLKGSSLKVVSVVGFPNGDVDTGEKVAQVRQAIADGAKEVDMVIKVGALKKGENQAVEKDIEQVVETAHSRHIPVKVILEAGVLSDEEIKRGASLAISAGADFLKRSTGFEPEEKKIKDDSVRYHQLDLMAEMAGKSKWKKLLFFNKHVGMKDSGQIRTLETARGSVSHGADRLGISYDAAVRISEEESGKKWKAKEAIIFYTNDLQGHAEPFEDQSLAPPPKKVGGVAYVAGLMEKIRKENKGKPVFYIDGGDTFQGSVLSDHNQGLPIIAFLSKEKADGVAVGNHEFDAGWGIPVLKEMAKKIEFPWLCANLIDHVTRKVLPFLHASAVREHDGMKAGIVGVTTSNRSTFTQSNIKGLDLLPPGEAIGDQIKELDSKNPDLDLHIAAVHEGPDEMRPAAEKLEVPTVIIGGHTQEVYPDLSGPQNLAKMGKSLYVQAGEFGKYLGVLRVFVDPKSGEIMNYENKVIPVLDDKIRPDRKLNDLVREESQKVQAKLSRIVNHTSVDLLRNNKGESLLDDLITDAMREGTGADLAFVNSSGTRADILKGDITVRNLYEVIPWDIPAAIADIKARDLKAVLETSASSTNYGSDLPDILQVSGLSVVCDLSRPEGERVESIRLSGGEEIVKDGKLLDPDRTFRIATKDFLLEGARDYAGFKNAKNISHGELIRDLIAGYLEKHRVITSKEGRIVFKGVTP